MDKRSLCRGCRNDFYNHQGGMDGKGCWHLDGARVVQRTQVGTWQTPPYKWNPQATLSCHQPNGAHWITHDDPRVVDGSGQTDSS